MELLLSPHSLSPILIPAGFHVYFSLSLSLVSPLLLPRNLYYIEGPRGGQGFCLPAYLLEAFMKLLMRKKPLLLNKITDEPLDIRIFSCTGEIYARTNQSTLYTLSPNGYLQGCYCKYTLEKYVSIYSQIPFSGNRSTCRISYLPNQKKKKKFCLDFTQKLKEYCLDF